METGISLDQGDLCYVSGEDVNEQNIVRAHVVLRSAKGGPWESVDGWCTAKFLSGADGEEPLPEVDVRVDGLSLASSSRRVPIQDASYSSRDKEPRRSACSHLMKMSRASSARCFLMRLKFLEEIS